MVKQEDLEKIKAIANEFFEKMGFEAEIAAQVRQDGVLALDAQTPEPQLLIGREGETLAEIQHLLRAVLRKTLKPEQPEPLWLDLDVNDYKKKKQAYLRETAKKIADQVASSKEERELPPMPPYERRVVHTELAQRQDVISESRGEGQDRRVVIKPAGGRNNTTETF